MAAQLGTLLLAARRGHERERPHGAAPAQPSPPGRSHALSAQERVLGRAWQAEAAAQPHLGVPRGVADAVAPGLPLHLRQQLQGVHVARLRDAPHRPQRGDADELVHIAHEHGNRLPGAAFARRSYACHGVYRCQADECVLVPEQRGGLCQRFRPFAAVPLGRQAQEPELVAALLDTRRRREGCCSAGEDGVCPACDGCPRKLRQGRWSSHFHHAPACRALGPWRDSRAAQGAALRTWPWPRCQAADVAETPRRTHPGAQHVSCSEAGTRAPEAARRAKKA
mmetsp:Transcript_116890/g.355620  ORF Transcript_116890/g.355620 Transcript_116890/m.355620 type:complete len:281 (-) Transcript_116890:7-849(-)